MSHLFYFRDGSVVHPRETKTTSAIHKTVFLINPKDYKNITVTDLATLWHGTGFIGWEYELAGIFLSKVHESIRKHEKYADITLLFERDLFGAEHGTFTKEQIYNHLIKWFEFVEKTDNCIKLKCNIVP